MGLKGTVVTQRDKTLLQYLFENKIYTQKQIARDFFNNAKKQTVNSRLNKLLSEKLISRQGFQIEHKLGYTYSVLDKGIDIFSKDLPFTIDKRLFKSDSPQHDLGLVDLRRALQKRSMVNRYFSENSIRCYKELREDSSLMPYYQLRSDAVVQLEMNGQSFLCAFEYDRTRKSSTNYRKKIMDYYRFSRVQLVLYVCENRSMMKSLLELDEKLCPSKESKFLFCLKRDVLASKAEITFENFQGQTLSVN